MEWSNDLIVEFLELYEKEPSIWNPSDPGHKNRNQVQDSWKNIQDHLSVQLPIADLKKKKDSLMSTYRKLASRVRASKKTGSGTEEVFKPDWFAFEKMATFLHGVFQPRITISSERPLDQSTSGTFEIDNDDEENNEETPLTTTVLDPTEKQFKSSATKNKRKSSEIESRMDEAYNILKKASMEPSRDKCSLYSELLEQKLRDFDDNIREIAMHEIDNYLFHLKRNRSHINYLSHISQENAQSNQIPPFPYPTANTQRSSTSISTPLPSPLTEYVPSPQSISSSSSCNTSHTNHTLQNLVPGPLSIEHLFDNSYGQ